MNQRTRNGSRFRRGGERGGRAGGPRSPVPATPWVRVFVARMCTYQRNVYISHSEGPQELYISQLFGSVHHRTPAPRPLGPLARV